MFCDAFNSSIMYTWFVCRLVIHNFTTIDCGNWLFIFHSRQHTSSHRFMPQFFIGVYCILFIQRFDLVTNRFVYGECSGPSTLQIEIDKIMLFIVCRFGMELDQRERARERARWWWCGRHVATIVYFCRLLLLLFVLFFCVHLSLHNNSK